MILETIAAGTAINWGAVITAGISVVSGGALLGLYQQWSKNRAAERKDENEPELALRHTLLSQVEYLTEKIDALYDKQEKLIADNASLKAQLEIANKHILELQAEIKAMK